MKQASAIRGFTLIELMIVVAFAGALMAIAAPGWYSFKNRQALNTAQKEVLEAMRESQKKAIHHRSKWQTSFRESRGRVQWATHPVGEVPSDGSWQTLPRNVKLARETTLRRVKGVRDVQFDYLGQVHGRQGQLVLSPKNDGSMKRCIAVATLLGEIRTGAIQARPGKGKGSGKGNSCV